ncbi:hypothetical protein CLNEO_29400 [Anaerotignum neopropionicum]|uniref:Uncharacterized protein n=1 Tax=Anaerotignum neopropionicum TaxID=36847 RepID=A0A136WAZ5_9FIRM|nr:hypothetical protein [Anaerotignum neopropionicum]KXL51688.1 hypothetical protein CLNEO_29400 [Anaerotignum neopropionicum]
MKKYILYFITTLLLLGTTACSKKSVSSAAQEAQAAQVGLADIASMQEPIDSLLRCILENNIPYDPTDPNFFWTALYYFLESYGEENPLVTTTEDGKIKVPKKVAQEYAIALFANYDALLPLPQSLSNFITYDGNLETYLITPGEGSLSETVLSNYKEEENSHTITAKLISTLENKALLGECTITLQKNVFADGIEDPRYFYSVAEITPVSGFPSPPQNASAVFNGLADNHTVEVTHQDGTIQAYQFYDETVSKKLHTLNEGSAFSFSYTSNDSTGTNTILEIN